MEILGRNYVEFMEKIEAKLTLLKIRPPVKIIRSKDNTVNTYLLTSALTFITEEELKETQIKTISGLGTLTGNKSQKSYHENKKGGTATQIISFVNKCINEHNFELEVDTRNRIEGVISEILGNAEDHGIMNTWYVTANYLSKQHTENELIGELNLVFFNFGLSIFEGFEQTKEKNHEVYADLQQSYDWICSKYPKHTFTKENLFTLYALQDGSSRLKYEEKSRGTGTMKFINSFLEIGDFENQERNYMPKLSIISGCTHLICDNKYKPFREDTVNYLSLNFEKDLSILPAKSHLKTLPTPFPGTLLSVKIFLNEEHFNQKIL